MFPIEQSKMIQAYRELVNEFDIELLLLVYDFIND